MYTLAVVFDGVQTHGMVQNLQHGPHEVSCMCCATQVYKLTGETGSYRYMAPEVFRHEPYNLKVDVYSFAMIIFQLFETTTPFHGHDPVDAARQAAMLGARPGFPPRRNLTPMTQVTYCCQVNNAAHC